MNDYENFDNFNNNNYIFNDITRLSSKNLEKISKSRNKSQYINESLLDFNKISKNDMLDDLVTNIIEFKKMCCDPVQNKSFSLSNISSNYLLYHHLEKNLIEISYLSDPETRNKKIKALYKWYRKLLERNNSLKNMASKSYIEAYEKYDLKKNKNGNKIINHKNNNTKANYSTININKINDNEENSNTISNAIQSSSMITQKSDIISTNDNSNWDFMTYFYSNKNRTNSSTIPKNSSAIFSDYTNKEEKQKNVVLPLLKPEMKFSYSYNRPCSDHVSIEIENKIIDQKLKLVAEKRSLENINHKINEFGIMRAKLKENINNKYEMKNLIKMYVNKQNVEGSRNNIISPMLKKYVIKNPKILSKSVDYEGETKNNYTEKGLDKPNNNNDHINDNLTDNHANGNNNINAINNVSNEHKKGILMKNNSSRKKFLERKVTLSVSKKELREMYGFNKENLKKALKHSNSIKNKRNIKKREDYEVYKKALRLFYGINHTKIFVNNIQNIDKNSNLIIDNKDNEKIIEIKMKSKINKKFSEENSDKSNFIMDINSQMFSSNFLYNQKYQYLDSLNRTTKNKNIFENQNDDNKEYENKLNNDDPYKSKYKISNIYKLSAFHLDNLKKIQSYRNRNLNNDYKRYQSVDLNMKIKNELNNNYNLNKNNYLFMRKNMKPLKKIEFEQLKTKIKKINFKHSDRYDNIDEDNLEEFDDEDYSEDNDFNYGYYKNLVKNKNKFFRKNSSEIFMRKKRENSLLNALISPNDNLIYSLYYYPRPESKLLIRK